MSSKINKNLRTPNCLKILWMLFLRLLLFSSSYRFSLIILGGISGSTKILLTALLMLLIFNFSVLKMLAIGKNATLANAAETEQSFIFGGMILGIIRMNFM